MNTESNGFSSFMHGEGKTGLGQVVEFTCRPNERKRVRQFLRSKVRTIDISTTGRTNVQHGGYGRYTRYTITQHDYAGGNGEDGHGGYIEVLEIQNPPDGRWGIVINEWNSLSGGSFTEWDTLENARSAFSKHLWNDDEKIPKLPGFKRRVACAALDPWFYAVGNRLLVGDYAFPEGLENDPVYSFGRKFVVFDEDGIPSIKTCMGTQLLEKAQDRRSDPKAHFRIVYWDDGSVWDESSSNLHWAVKSENPRPRPILEGELWITEAVQQFRQLLAGKSAEFSINFLDGTKFVGKVVRQKNKIPCAEGNYFCAVHIEGESNPHEGWTGDFTPTTDTPDIVEYIKQRYAKSGKTVTRVEIIKCKTEKEGKKWAGVFSLRSP